MALLYLYVLVLTQLTIAKVFAIPAPPEDDPPVDYRLPHIFDTESYVLNLNVPADSLTNKSNVYTGTVTIGFRFTNISDYIALHAHHETIALNKVTFNNIQLSADDYSVNDDTNILNIRLVNPITTGRRYELVIEFTGRLSTTNMYGFYRSSYVDKDDVTHYLATTQFESTHAREAFPCFDEPEFKATFTVSITHPDNYNVLSNTKGTTGDSEGGVVTTTFDQTPKMSTYLLAFIVSHFSCSAGDPIDSVPYQVCSRSESADARGLAVAVGPQLIAKFNEFTGYNYNLSNSKLDQVAIPDFSPGAMENWGLVTYREAALLWDENESSNRYQQDIVTVMSHELSHQWFGDLVTCAWWSDIFLNEGFARYFEYHMAHEIFADWELDKQFVVEVLQSILEADASEDSLPLESEASTPAEISAKLGSISYNKGASILRMLAHVLGPDTFKAGLQKYLEDNKLSSVLPTDLWAALDSIDSAASQLPFRLSFQDVMEDWINNPGFPLVTVKSEGNNTITVSQLRFLIGSGTAYEWFVPITYTTSSDENKFENTLPSKWLYPSYILEITLPADATWIILNNQQTGYYRVNYDDTLWDAIKTALTRENFDGIVDLNRAQIVDDLFNLAKVGRVSYSRTFEVTSFLSNDTSYYPWYAAFNEYAYLLRRVGENSKIGQAIGMSLMSLMDKLYDSVPISDLKPGDQIYTLTQVLTLTWSCKVGHDKCVEATRSLFNDYKTSSNRPDKNLRSIVYCNGLRYSNDTSDWDFLWDAYTKSSDLATEQLTILSALGCTKDVDLLKKYLEKTITDDSGIRPQDASAVFSSVYSGNAEGVAVAFDFLVENYKTIPDKYQSNVLPNFIKAVADRFTTEEEVAKLKSFISDNALPDDLKTAADDAVKQSDSNLQWLTTFEAELRDYYDLNSVGPMNASLLVIALAFIISKFL